MCVTRLQDILWCTVFTGAWKLEVQMRWKAPSAGRPPPSHARKHVFLYLKFPLRSTSSFTVALSLQLRLSCAAYCHETTAKTHKVCKKKTVRATRFLSGTYYWRKKLARKELGERFAWAWRHMQGSWELWDVLVPVSHCERCRRLVEVVLLHWSLA